MRLWTIHPTFLDNEGLHGLWREGLLAQKIIEDPTHGRSNNPQIARFRNHVSPISILGAYLWTVGHEGMERGFKYNVARIEDPPMLGSIMVPKGSSGDPRIPVTEEQIRFEFDHLFSKLEERDPVSLEKILNYSVQSTIKYREDFRLKAINPAFRIVVGPIESWEKVSYHNTKYRGLFTKILNAKKNKLARFDKELEDWGVPGKFQERFNWREVAEKLK